MLVLAPSHVSRTTLACVNESLEDPPKQALSGHITEFEELNKVCVDFTQENQSPVTSFSAGHAGGPSSRPVLGETMGTPAAPPAWSSAPPALPHEAGDSPAHMPPAGCGLPSSSLLPQSGGKT